MVTHHGKVSDWVFFWKLIRMKTVAFILISSLIPTAFASIVGYEFEDNKQWKRYIKLNIQKYWNAKSTKHALMLKRQKYTSPTICYVHFNIDNVAFKDQRLIVLDGCRKMGRWIMPWGNIHLFAYFWFVFICHFFHSFFRFLNDNFIGQDCQKLFLSASISTLNLIGRTNNRNLVYMDLGCFPCFGCWGILMSRYSQLVPFMDFRTDYGDNVIEAFWGIDQIY